jgi:hypothetical protein
MSKSSRLLKKLWRRATRGKGGGFKYHYQKAEHHRRVDGQKNPTEPWEDIVKLADLRPDDVVLDMGCAEGLISMQVAKHVRHVDGVEIMADRAQEGNRLAAERGIKNATFKSGSVIDYPVAPMSYDVTLFLAVMDKVIDDGPAVGLRELEKLLNATRRQIVVRYNVQRIPHDRAISLQDVLAKMNECGFDAICFAKHSLPNIILGHRRGTDARARTVPPFVLVPAESMHKHPCIGDARVGGYGEFS